MSQKWLRHECIFPLGTGRVAVKLQSDLQVGSSVCALTQCKFGVWQCHCCAMPGSLEGFSVSQLRWANRFCNLKVQRLLALENWRSSDISRIMRRTRYRRTHSWTRKLSGWQLSAFFGVEFAMSLASQTSNHSQCISHEGSHNFHSRCPLSKSGSLDSSNFAPGIKSTDKPRKRLPTWLLIAKPSR